MSNVNLETATPEATEEKPSRRKSIIITAVIVIALLLAGVAGYFAYQSAQPRTEEGIAFVEEALESGFGSLDGLTIEASEDGQSVSITYDDSFGSLFFDFCDCYVYGNHSKWSALTTSTDEVTKSLHEILEEDYNMRGDVSITTVSAGITLHVSVNGGSTYDAWDDVDSYL